ncbi:PQQ-binding-like beta-propeller repeat protein [Kitasatospora sp. NPDC058201]|uniref:outer membrane protein assembly factor BamB family protein n=1 Tax=unclassified Kitasatospora TaxID=2633591 RepID=UPI00364A8171
MPSVPSERSESAGREPGEASWQWDGEGGGTDGGRADVLSGGGGGERGPGPNRRRLLLGAGVLAAGAAVWGVSRSSGGPEPAPPKPLPLPTRVNGPEPLWTYRGPAPMTPLRLDGRPNAPVHLSGDALRVLDRDTGAVTRTMEFPVSKGAPADSPVIVGAGRVFTTSPGHIDARTLIGPFADWSMPLPEELGDRVTLLGCDGSLLYGRAESRPLGPGGRLFAVNATTHTVVWSRPAAERGEGLVAALDWSGRLLARDSDPTAGVSLLDGATGRRLWGAAGSAAWSAIDLENLYLPDGAAGVRALRHADGVPRWSIAPGQGEEWRALPPVSDGTQVYVLRDNGLVTAHAVATGEQLWRHELPFRLDRRTRPVLAGAELIVPGPAADGLHHLETVSGRESRSFTDSGPGVDVWSVFTDGANLYGGHDSVLYAMGPLPVP